MRGLLCIPAVPDRENVGWRVDDFLPGTEGPGAARGITFAHSASLSSKEKLFPGSRIVRGSFIRGFGFLAAFAIIRRSVQHLGGALDQGLFRNDLLQIS